MGGVNVAAHPRRPLAGASNYLDRCAAADGCSRLILIQPAQMLLYGTGVRIEECVDLRGKARAERIE